MTTAPFADLVRAAAGVLAPGLSDAEGLRRLADALDVSTNTTRKWMYEGVEPPESRRKAVEAKLQALVNLDVGEMVELAFGCQMPDSAEGVIAREFLDADGLPSVEEVDEAAVALLRRAGRAYGAEIGKDMPAAIVGRLHIRPEIVIERIRALQYLRPAVEQTPVFAARLAVLALRGNEDDRAEIDAGFAPRDLVLRAVEDLQGPLPAGVDAGIVAVEADEIAVRCGVWLSRALQGDGA